ncbi:hypothetical protein [Gardnerella pickettii]|uniref:hypothetical protein n=1 Tax=Gardnerella pickettii TaxID=2914924 RepID=UPI000764234F|nr:hypothetical protein [Gardnerella pickettii]KXA16276.1 hypothetical protein HMPREF3204_00604 [Gardnerella pickettii]
MNAKIAAAISLGASSLALIGSISIANAANAAPATTTLTQDVQTTAAPVSSVAQAGEDFSRVSEPVTIDPKGAAGDADASGKNQAPGVAGTAGTAGAATGATAAGGQADGAEGKNAVPNQDSKANQPQASQDGTVQVNSDPSASAQGDSSEKKEDQQKENKGSKGNTGAQAGGKASTTPPKEAVDKLAEANKSMIEAQNIYDSINEEVTKANAEADEAIKNLNAELEKKPQSVKDIEKAKQAVLDKTKDLENAEDKNAAQKELDASRQDLERATKDASNVMDGIMNASKKVAEAQKKIQNAESKVDEATGKISEMSNTVSDILTDLRNKYPNNFGQYGTSETPFTIVQGRLTANLQDLGTATINLNKRKKLLAAAAKNAEEALSSGLPSADEPDANAPQEQVPPMQNQQNAPAPAPVPPAASKPQDAQPENKVQNGSSSSQGSFAGSTAKQNGGNLSVVPGVGSMDASPSAPVPSTPQNAPQNNAAPSAPQEPAPQSAPKHSAAPANQTEPAHTAKAAEKLVENATDKSQATAETPARTPRAAAPAAPASAATAAAPTASSASATKSEESKNTSNDSAKDENQKESEDSKNEDSKNEDSKSEDAKSSDKSAQASGANNGEHAAGNNTTLIAAVAGSITAGIAAIGAGWHFMRIRRK